MSHTATLAAAFLLVATLPAVAQAQDQRKLRDACLSDARSFCSTVQPGGGRLLLCLDANRAKLTQACAAALPSSDAIRARTGG